MGKCYLLLSVPWTERDCFAEDLIGTNWWPGAEQCIVGDFQMFFPSFWYKKIYLSTCLFLHYGVKASGVKLLSVLNCPLVNQLPPGRLKVNEFDTGRWGWTIILWLCVSAKVSNSITWISLWFPQLLISFKLILTSSAFSHIASTIWNTFYPPIPGYIKILCVFPWRYMPDVNGIFIWYARVCMFVCVNVYYVCFVHSSNLKRIFDHHRSPWHITPNWSQGCTWLSSFHISSKVCIISKGWVIIRFIKKKHLTA